MLHVEIAKRRGAFLLDVAFQVPTPGIVALFGRSGCGKTSVVEILAGLLEPDSGDVRLGDLVFVDTSAGYSLPAERRRIGYVFQDARLFPHLSVRGNLRYGQKRAPAPPHATPRPYWLRCTWPVDGSSAPRGTGPRGVPRGRSRITPAPLRDSSRCPG